MFTFCRTVNKKTTLTAKKRLCNRFGFISMYVYEIPQQNFKWKQHKNKACAPNFNTVLWFHFHIQLYRTQKHCSFQADFWTMKIQPKKLPFSSSSAVLITNALQTFSVRYFSFNSWLISLIVTIVSSGTCYSRDVVDFVRRFLMKFHGSPDRML